MNLMCIHWHGLVFIFWLLADAILKCNDEVLKVMTDYKRIVAGDTSTQNGSLISMDAAPNTSTTQGAFSFALLLSLFLLLPVVSCVSKDSFFIAWGQSILHL